jgi:hypothetical protein
MGVPMSGLPGRFEETLAFLVSMAEKLDADWMHIGGVAINYWGQPRATGDVDVALSVSMDLSTKITKYMSRGGWNLVGGPGQIKKTGVYLSQYAKELDGGGILGVDIFFAMNDWQRLALSRRSRVTFSGQSHWVASAEDLVLYKLIANRGKDIGDVDNVLDNQYSSLDMQYLESWARTLQLDDRLAEALSRFHDRKDMGL